MSGHVMTRRATRDMNGIFDHTIERWDVEQARKYILDLEAAFNKVVQDPDLGLHRMYRSAPFRMVREQSHFIVYEVHADWIVIAAVPHARADIEGLVRDMTPDYRRELEALKARFPELDNAGRILGRD